MWIWHTMSNILLFVSWQCNCVHVTCVSTWLLLTLPVTCVKAVALVLPLMPSGQRGQIRPVLVFYTGHVSQCSQPSPTVAGLAIYLYFMYILFLSETTVPHVPTKRSARVYDGRLWEPKCSALVASASPNPAWYQWVCASAEWACHMCMTGGPCVCCERRSNWPAAW